MSEAMHISHVTRQVKTALELAIAAFAPTELVDRLAVVAGLLDALQSLAIDDTTQLPLIGKTRERAHSALEAWSRWQADHPKANA
jgi:hypothetical protein